MASPRTLIFVFVLALVPAFLVAPCAAHADEAPSSAERAWEPNAVIDLLDLRPTFDALAKREGEGGGTAEERDALRRTARGRILDADAQLATFSARIDRERNQVLDVSRWLDARTSSRVTWLTVASGLFAVGAAVGTGMTLDDNLSRAGTAVTTITSGIGAALAFATLVPWRDPDPLGIDDNVLAPLFGKPSRRAYPPFVARFAAARSPDDPRIRSHGEALIARWRAVRWLPKPPEDREVVVAVTSRTLTGQRVDGDTLVIRGRMLADLQCELIELHAGLTVILALLSG